MNILQSLFKWIDNSDERDFRTCQFERFCSIDCRAFYITSIKREVTGYLIQVSILAKLGGFSKSYRNKVPQSVSCSLKLKFLQYGEVPNVAVGISIIRGPVGCKLVRTQISKVNNIFGRNVVRYVLTSRDHFSLRSEIIENIHFSVILYAY